MSGSDDGQAARLPFASATGAEVRLAVRLTPRATRNGLDGGVAAGPDGRPALLLLLLLLLLLRVAAPPRRSPGKRRTPSTPHGAP